jgi:carboxylesterase type B
LYEGSYLANDSNIVVVTINYRLGALGFLVLGDEVDGNFGIKDQRLALEWVQENIRNFGGNPGAVTLSGESAGAMSVAIHMTSDKSRGLFTRPSLRVILLELTIGLHEQKSNLALILLRKCIVISLCLIVSVKRLISACII